MTSLLEYLDRDWEMTVLPQPKAPGMAVVPPCTQLGTGTRGDGPERWLWRGDGPPPPPRDVPIPPGDCLE